MAVSQATCIDTIDYTDKPTTGSKKLPFRITLNRDLSILEPGEGQFQKFYYIVEGTLEEGSSDYADLSHMLFGICPTITQENIRSLYVEINGVEQPIVWGDTVEIKTPANPDPTTGCSGLKLDFEVDKVEGEMIVILELNEPYPVGPVNVCLKGGNGDGGAVSGLYICGPACGSTDNCPAIGYQTATICAPIRVEPRARIGRPVSYCCGDPVVTPGRTSCTGRSTNCYFTISQRICVEVPVYFSADAHLNGPVTVDCENAQLNGCTNCNSNPE